MSLTINIDEPKPKTKRLQLDGSLDVNTAAQLEQELDANLNDEVKDVILDLGKLQYISSAGLRVIFKLRKTMKNRNGKTYAVNVQPQVRKVFDIVKAMPTDSVFSSIEELDRYLETIQRRIIENG